MSIFKTHEIIREGGEVLRFHNKFLLKPQNVATHSFNCALLVHHLANTYRNHTQIRPEICMAYMLLHDVPEQEFGDIMGHVKNGRIKEEMDTMENEWAKEKYPEDWYDISNSLNIKETALCSFVDKIECAITSLEEYELGNKRLEKTFMHCYCAALKYVYEMNYYDEKLWNVCCNFLEEFYEQSTREIKDLIEACEGMYEESNCA